MREVQVSEAQGRLNELLGEVERGESVVITREGRPIARLVPEPPARRREDVLADIEAFRARMPKVSVDEILAWRHEGHDR